MNDEVGHYERILADAEAEIERLQTVVAEISELKAVAAFARKKLGLPPSGTQTATITTAWVPGPPPGPAIGTKLTGDTIPSDAFFRMSPSGAIEKYLNIVKGPKSVNVIADALRNGGLPSKSQDLYTTVYAALRRGQGNVFSKVKKEWGLAEWYR